MKIVLVVTGAKGKNVVFISDTLQTYPLEKAVALARKGTFENVYAVKGRTGAYLRTKPGVVKKEHLDRLSVSSYQLFSSVDDIGHALSTPAFDNYWLVYQNSLKKGEGPFIVIGGHALITKKMAKEKLQPHRKLVFEAAKKFKVDPYLLGAIIIDEIARFGPIEPITDPLAGYFIGVNTSAGIAQVKTDTARGLIKNGYYNPNPKDNNLSPERIQKIPLSYLYKYVVQPEHSISFAAAKMRALIDKWQKSVDISKSPDIIATLYSLKGKIPHAHPHPNDRGLQIANEFYKLAQEYLGLP